MWIVRKCCVLTFSFLCLVFNTVQINVQKPCLVVLSTPRIVINQMFVLLLQCYDKKKKWPIQLTEESVWFWYGAKSKTLTMRTWQQAGRQAWYLCCHWELTNSRQTERHWEWLSCTLPRDPFHNQSPNTDTIEQGQKDFAEGSLL